MLKKLLIATAAGGLMVSTALAQQSPSSATAPAASPAPAADAAKAMPADAKFITAQGPDQWVASKFKGTDVLGPNNEHIGDVDDMLFDKNGKILAFIVGVGGFLGIGEKNVALDMSAFQVVPANTGSATTGTATTGTATTASADNDPNHIKLKVSWTKDQLKAAPAFEYWKAAARTTGSATSPNTGAARPAPATPPATNR